MLRTFTLTRSYGWTQRAALIALFVGLTIVSAQLKFYFGSPVPVTLQVLVVLLAGLTLGARDGALSQVVYVGLVALNLPVDTNLAGAAALTGATAGYLVGFIPAAFVTGWLAEHGANRVWQRWLAGIVGVAVIYALGVTVLRAVTGMTWGEAFAAGVAPFVVIDLIKAVIAAGLSETARAAFINRLSR